jgi:hypothetical protein
MQYQIETDYALQQLTVQQAQDIQTTGTRTRDALLSLYDSVALQSQHTRANKGNMTGTHQQQFSSAVRRDCAQLAYSHYCCTNVLARMT